MFVSSEIISSLVIIGCLKNEKMNNLPSNLESVILKEIDFISGSVRLRVPL